MGHFAIVQAGAAAGRRLGTALSEEGRLIRLARRGDDDAWRELVNRHQHAVYATTLRLLGSRDDALDVSQETFLSAFRSIGSFKAESSFRTWLIKIAMRQAYQAARARPNCQSMETAILPETAIAADDHELKNFVEAAVAALPLSLRAVITLREYQGFSYTEIADALAIAPGTVQSRLHRGRRRLRELLYTYLEEDTNV